MDVTLPNLSMFFDPFLFKFVFVELSTHLLISFLQSELENLAFMYTNPQDHAKIKRRVAELYGEHEKDLKEVTGWNCNSY